MRIEHLPFQCLQGMAEDAKHIKPRSRTHQSHEPPKTNKQSRTHQSHAHPKTNKRLSRRSSRCCALLPRFVMPLAVGLFAVWLPWFHCGGAIPPGDVRRCTPARKPRQPNGTETHGKRQHKLRQGAQQRDPRQEEATTFREGL